MKKRYLTEQVKADLKKKMAFVAGARQVGKLDGIRVMPALRFFSGLAGIPISR